MEATLKEIEKSLSKFPGKLVNLQIEDGEPMSIFKEEIVEDIRGNIGYEIVDIPEVTEDSYTLKTRDHTIHFKFSKFQE